MTTQGKREWKVLIGRKRCWWLSVEQMSVCLRGKQYCREMQWEIWASRDVITQLSWPGFLIYPEHARKELGSFRWGSERTRPLFLKFVVQDWIEKTARGRCWKEIYLEWTSRFFPAADFLQTLHASSSGIWCVIF